MSDVLHFAVEVENGDEKESFIFTSLAHEAMRTNCEKENKDAYSPYLAVLLHFFYCG
jgi:hypothetical protein